jgi:hypothetical protein
MLAHEWIRTADGWRKVDALDHGDDHFFPGHPQDPAWDLAGAIVELSLAPTAAAALVERYRRLSGDAAIAARLPAFRVAYLAFRAGYASIAADTLAGSDDGARFAHERDRRVAELRAATLFTP